MTLLWKTPLWPSFYWSSSELLDGLTQARFAQGRVLGLANPFVHSYEISDRKSALFEDLLKSGPLHAERLHGWQASLFPTGYSGVKKIKIAAWREHALQLSASKSAFALEPQLIAENFQLFLSWWHEPPVDLDPLVRSAISFFWFISIAPYEDGNYTLACALSELALMQSEGQGTRFYDLALQLEEQRTRVIEELRRAQSSDGNLTTWIRFFLQLYREAVEAAVAIGEQDRIEADFWKSISRFDLSSREKLVLKHLFDQKINSVTNREYVQIANTTRESAKRDLKHLSDNGLLRRLSAKGRSVRYMVEFPE